MPIKNEFVRFIQLYGFYSTFAPMSAFGEKVFRISTIFAKNVD